MIERSASERLIAWTFAIASVAVGWQLQLPSLIGEITTRLGVNPGSFLQSAIVDVGVPIVLGTLAWGAAQLYYTTLWPLLSPNHKGGWWVYALVAKVGDKFVDTVGCFYIEHRPVGAAVVEGHAFYLNDSQRTYRGDFHADVVWITKAQLRYLYSMHSLNQIREPLPSHYEGYLELRLVREEPLAGTSAWRGYFQDLGDRHSISGPVYAEKFSRIRARRNERLVEDALTQQAVTLIQRAWVKVPTQPPM